MPFNVASIKDRAVSAKNATVSKMQDVRDKHSSTPMARTRFAEDGYAPKAPPPPPPGRRSFNSSHEGGDENETGADTYGYRPPPVVRTTKPGASTSAPSPPPPPSRGQSVLHRAKMFENASPSPSPSPLALSPTPSRSSAHRWSAQPAVGHQQQLSSTSINTQADVDRIDWTNLSHEDKQAFFGWLDEFFVQYIEKMNGVHLDSPSEGGRIETREKYRKPPPAPAMPASGANTSPTPGPPPPIRSWSKPTASPSSTPSQSQSYSQPQTVSEFQSSYPPPTTYGSQAIDLAYYFHPSNEWDTPWYATQGAVPPPFQTNPHKLYKAQMLSRGDARSITFAVLFCDLSAAWVSVSYSNATKQISERWARYLGMPDPVGGEELREASEMYGETIASYAESFLGSGQYCARGECWDLASEALKFVTSSASVPAPIPSLGRTHGHLIFVGRATKERGGIRQEGRWRGGDDRVRRGDIAEWRSVRITRVGDPPGGYAILGDPEHTAVITRDSIPSSRQTGGGIYDGAPLEPGALVSLEVVEQSLNDPPEPVKRTYDLNRFEEGELWIYRPFSMERYLGFAELTCEVPPHAESI